MASPAHTTDAHAHGDAHGHHDGEFAHPASITMLLTIFVILLLLTGLTVYQFDAGLRRLRNNLLVGNCDGEGWPCYHVLHAHALGQAIKRDHFL